MPDRFYHSAELRWFLPQENEKDRLLRWFRGQDQLPLHEEGCYDPKVAIAPFVKRERERADEYLLLPNCDTVGIKQRQGNLEVKALVAGPRPFALNNMIGRMDQWVKWSFTPSEPIAHPLEIELDQSGPWRRVDKTRYLQKYAFDSGVIAVSPDQRPNAGCNIELTVINVKANVEAWLTFGFEAFGPPEQVMAVLSESVVHYFAVHGSPPVVLEGSNSLSYPAWLTLLS